MAGEGTADARLAPPLPSPPPLAGSHAIGLIPSRSGSGWPAAASLAADSQKKVPKQLSFNRGLC